MGVNVIIYDDENTEHPTWDWLRRSGDQHIERVLGETGVEIKQFGHPMDGEVRLRPTDVEKFTAVMISEFPENAERWRELKVILTDPRWRLYFSW